MEFALLLPLRMDRSKGEHHMPLKGRAAFQEYLRVLEQIVKAGRK